MQQGNRWPETAGYWLRWLATCAGAAIASASSLALLVLVVAAGGG